MDPNPDNGFGSNQYGEHAVIRSFGFNNQAYNAPNRPRPGEGSENLGSLFVRAAEGLRVRCEWGRQARRARTCASRGCINPPLLSACHLARPGRTGEDRVSVLSILTWHLHHPRTLTKADTVVGQATMPNNQTNSLSWRSTSKRGRTTPPTKSRTESKSMGQNNPAIHKVLAMGQNNP